MTRSATAIRHGAVKDFAQDLVHVVLHRKLHSATSRYVQDAIADLLRSLRRAQEAGVVMPLQLQFSAHRIHHDGLPLDGPSLQAGILLQACCTHRIATLSFADGLAADELNRCLDLLLLPQNHGALQRSRREEVLRAFGIRHIAVGLDTPAAPDNRHRSLAGEEEALHSYQDLATSLQQSHARAFRDQELAVDDVQTVIERTLPQFEEPSTLLALATQDDVDRFTVGHSVRVALLALQVARAVGATRDQLVQVGAAALMHDIGKSKVPQEILWKRGRLSEDEWHWMAQHPRLGAQILLEQNEAVDPSAVGAAFCHHMGPDGHGYPHSELPIAPSATSCLIRVCDVFEALTSVRPYKRALLPIEAYAVMFRNEQDFDPQWLRHFVRTIGLYPTGSRVVLADGSPALVVRQNNDPERPTVRLLGAAGGSVLPADHPEELTVDPGDAARRILAIDGQDRMLCLPEPTDAAAAGQTAAHACLSSSIDATTQRAS